MSAMTASMSLLHSWAFFRASCGYRGSSRSGQVSRAAAWKATTVQALFSRFIIPARTLGFLPVNVEIADAVRGVRAVSPVFLVFPDGGLDAAAVMACRMASQVACETSGGAVEGGRVSSRSVGGSFLAWRLILFLFLPFP